MECTLITEHKCRISFTVVEGETETTAYNLQIHGKFRYSVRVRVSSSVRLISSSLLCQVVQILHKSQ